MTTSADYDEPELDEDPEVEGQAHLPNAILIPLVALGLLALAGAGIALIGLLGKSSQWAALVPATVSALAIVLIVGLRRGNRAAHAITYGLAGTIALIGLATFLAGGLLLVALGGAVVWALQSRPAKDWCGIR